MDNVIEASTSNVSVVHDNQSIQSEAKPMNININKNSVKKFDWIVYKYTIKQLNINAEYKALRHFNKYARPGTKNYIKYLRNLYGIMPYFDERIYMKYANINENITLEQLYIYFRTEGYKNFPLDENYDRLYYDIEETFDADAYYKRYNDVIDNYLYTDDNYDAGSDEWETGSQMSSITSFSQMSTATTQTRGSMLSTFIDNANNHRHGRIVSHDERVAQTNNDEYNKWKETLYNWYEVKDTLNKKVYKFYQENKDKHPMDNKYYLIKYNISNPLFEPSVYIKINNLNYNLNYNDDLDRIYKIYSKNQLLDDNYYRLYYDIPDDLKIEIFIQRYFNFFENKKDFFKIITQEQNNYVYMVFNKLKDLDNFSYLDDTYFKLYYNIPDEFNFHSYITRYPEITNKINSKNLKSVNKYVKISKETKYIYENFKVYNTQYELDDNYYRILFNIPKEFDYNIFITVYPEVVKINNLQDDTVMNELSDYVKESVLFDNKIKLYKYYSENSEKYNFNDTYYNKYFIKENNILVSFNADTYIDMYEHLKLKIKSIQFDKNENKKEYYELYFKYLLKEFEENPLDDKYCKKLYNICDDLDANSYVKRYTNELSSKITNINENTLEYNEKVYQLVNLNTMPLDDNYYKILNKLPQEFDAQIYIKKYPDIKLKLFNIPEDTIEYNKQLYSLVNLELMPLDENYYRLLYDIPDDLDFKLYLQIYPDVLDKLNDNDYNNETDFRISFYKIINLKLMPLNDEYYRLKYKIPELLDSISYVKRYPDINDELKGLSENTLEYNKKVYSLCTTLLNYFKLDEKYYKIKYDIPFLFHLQSIVMYKTEHNINFDNNYVNEYQWFYNEGKNKIDLLSEKYLNILFSVTDDFKWKIYYFNNKDEIDNSPFDKIINTLDDDNINKLKSYCHFKTKNMNITDFLENNVISINNNNELLETINIDKKKYYNIDIDFNHLNYSDNHPYFYMNTRINVTSDFVYLFYTDKITLKDLYELYKNNKNHENISTKELFTSKELQIEEKFIKNYEYLLLQNIDSKKYKDYFVLNDFIEDFYRNRNRNSYIKLEEKNESDIIDKVINNKNLKHRILFNNYKKINYNNLFYKFKNEKLNFSSNKTDINIAYIYFAYDKSLFTIANFLNSIKYIPDNAKVYVFTNHNEFDEIFNYMNNVETIFTNTINTISMDVVINTHIIDYNYIFVWNANYMMMNDHTFINNEILDNIMISNNNINYVNIGILRKKIGNTFKTISNDDNLATFRKHKKMHFIVSI